jgi:hypothetical protein
LSPPAALAETSGLAGGQIRDVLEVERPPGGALHRDQIVESNDPDVDFCDAGRERALRELAERGGTGWISNDVEAPGRGTCVEGRAEPDQC